ncbi:hypothetical protein SAY86_022706 [Trapa natans]|uniref:AP2/ERF domain-containing protein n=1 Tax=Trapa natans TaxID=22666 RepID=A0AAN7R9I4_TRANT|nr:hypothetical protein SAY86_022706 [Trapa natans]
MKPKETPTPAVFGASSSSSSSSSPPSNIRKYKGVRKRKWGRWVSEIRLPNSRERIWLGSYESAEKAARAFDAALFCLRGSNAKFNFPSTPSEISAGTGHNLTHQEIQAVAARYANGRESSGMEEAEGRPAASYHEASSLQGSGGGGEQEGGVGNMDWSFLGALNERDIGGISDFGFSYSEEYDYMTMESDQLHHYPPPPAVEGNAGHGSNIGDGMDYDDGDGNGNGGSSSDSGYFGYSNSSFLWNF